MMAARIDRNVWNGYVARGRQLANRGRRASWEIADLALEVCPIRRGSRGNSHSNDATQQVLERLSNDAGLDQSATVLRRWRLAADAWPIDKRVEGCAIEAHLILATHPQRFKLLKPGMSINEARRLRPHGYQRKDRVNFQDALRFLDASAGFLGTAKKALGTLPLESEHAELVGEHVAALEAALEEFLEFVGMEDEDTGLRLAA